MDVNYVLKEENFTVPQYERVGKLREVVPAWLEEVEPEQALIIGLIPIGGNWSQVELAIVGPHMVENFVAWLDENKEHITGPHYMLPKLQGFFQLISIRLDYNPDKHGIPANCSPSARATLERFAEQLRQQVVT
jgi:hypothetical protein